MKVAARGGTCSSPSALYTSPSRFSCKCLSCLLSLDLTIVTHCTVVVYSLRPLVVSPTIRARQQMIGTRNGASITLECQVEAFPPPLVFWIHGENRMIETTSQTSKYRVFQQDSAPYTNVITLNISNIEETDYGLYKCVAKNERGTTSGLLTLYGELTLPLPSSLSLFFTL